MIDRERLISQKRNNKASAEGARLPKEAMLLRDIYKFTKPSLDAFRPFGLISKAGQKRKYIGQNPPYIRQKNSCKIYRKFLIYILEIVDAGI